MGGTGFGGRVAVCCAVPLVKKSVILDCVLCWEGVSGIALSIWAGTASVSST